MPAVVDYVYRVTTASRMAARGFRPVTITAELLFESLPADGSIEVRWEGFGHVAGVERFSTHMMRRSDRGVEVLRVAPGSTSHLEPILVHPLGKGRTVRTFARARR